MSSASPSRALVIAALCLGAAACSGGGQQVERIDPAPPPSATQPDDASSTDMPDGGAESSAAGDGDSIGVAFAGVEAIDARDAASLARGGIPAALRLRGEQSVISTSLTCPRKAQRVLDVPIRRDGLVQLRVSARVAARLAGATDAVVLGPRTDLAVLLARDERGHVRGRATALQIDDRWFVREVEICDDGRD